MEIIGGVSAEADGSLSWISYDKKTGKEGRSEENLSVLSQPPILINDILISTFKVSEHISKLDATMKSSEKVKSNETSALDHRILLETKKVQRLINI